MWALRLGPFPGKRRKVKAVAGDQHPVLAGGQFEDGRIVQAFEGGVFGESTHIVSGHAQRTRDPTGREIRIEQQPHAAGYPFAVRCTKG